LFIIKNQRVSTCFPANSRPASGWSIVSPAVNTNLAVQAGRCHSAFQAAGSAAGGHGQYATFSQPQETSMKNNRFTALLLAATLTAMLAGCATEGSRSLPVEQVETVNKPYTGQRVTISLGKFDNRSSYMRGIFTDGADRLGSQAKTILLTHLQQTNRFNVLDRDNMKELSQEASLANKAQKLKGAAYVVTGDVTEFGRKEVGDQQLFGILGRGKSQVAYAKVNLDIVDSLTSEVVYSTQGAGEYNLSNRDVVGFGGTAGYDSTLNGKVLDLAIREGVNKLAAALDNGAWQPK
jgi:curli biogenesis system outer membrane secretion channel CsgG